MTAPDPRQRTAQAYRAFADREARGRSPRYQALAATAADDGQVLDFLLTLPRAKRQPNLLFAAARYLLGEPAGIESLRALIADRPVELTAVIQSRRTQTNEPARCATVLPALALLPQPLALLEVGASAGLTLLTDKYSYDYAGHRVTGTDPDAPLIACEPRGPVPLPGKMPEVVWRAGLDLNPLDVTDEDDMRWLGCLLWPGEEGRAERLSAAIATARRHPPTIHRGDLLTDVPALAAQAPADANLVTYHTSVLAYVDKEGRERFAETVKSLDAVWLSNEVPMLTPAIAIPDKHDQLVNVLVRDGATALASSDPHGTWVEWLT